MPTKVVIWPNSKKHVYKLWRSGVDFPARPYTFDPYLVGAYLGDGSKHNPVITLGSKKKPILEYFENSTQYPVLRKEFEKGAYYLYGRHTEGLFSYLKPILGNRHIPEIYKVNDYQTRMQVLAGLLDTDGHLQQSGFDIVQKSKQLAEDICFISRSVGLAAYMSEKWLSGVLYQEILI